MSITSRSSDFSKWYNDIVQFANLAESSPVRGCMIVKPYGYAIWENIQTLLDKRFKETGHNNVYFPMFIPLSYFSKEASHVSGFAKECAVVTHYRLKEVNNTVIVDPTAKLENELIVRPTSETIIWSTLKNWIHSYRDLPLKLNQWCNVCRWEMRNRPFLRTSEFLWQEGHTAHISYDEALQEAKTMLQIYDDIGRDYLAIPFLKGIKTEYERFAGADITFTIEALMQDGKALQSGTSHLLGQHFAKVFDVKYADQNGKFKYVWGTSWGMSTRILGALIMTHSDDKGLVLPPKIAPIQVVIVPIYKTDDELAKAIQYVNSEIIPYLERAHVRVKFDDVNGYRPSEKFEKYELMGVPIRLVVGSRDINNKTCEFCRRDTFEKNTVNVSSITDVVLSLISEIHNNLYDRALKFRQSHTVYVDTYEEFCKAIEDKAGFVLAHWDGTTETEQLIQQETKATIRCILLDEVDDCCGKCIKTGQPSKQRVVFAQAY